MRIANQLKFMASNLLSEAADAVDDFRVGVVPEVRVEADRLLDQAQEFVDDTLVKTQDFVLELKEQLVTQATA